MKNTKLCMKKTPDVTMEVCGGLCNSQSEGKQEPHLSYCFGWCCPWCSNANKRITGSILFGSLVDKLHFLSIKIVSMDKNYEHRDNQEETQF